MSIADILGMEDNPFGLFLVLILLLGATGYFDPSNKMTGESETSPESSPPSAVLPVWQTRPGGPKLVRPFTGPKPRDPRSGIVRDRNGTGRERLLPAIVDMLGLPGQRRTGFGRGRAFPLGSKRHPFLRLWHKMQQ